MEVPATPSCPSATHTSAQSRGAAPPRVGSPVDEIRRGPFDEVSARVTVTLGPTLSLTQSLTLTRTRTRTLTLTLNLTLTLTSASTRLVRPSQVQLRRGLRATTASPRRTRTPCPARRRTHRSPRSARGCEHTNPLLYYVLANQGQTSHQRAQGRAGAGARTPLMNIGRTR